VLEFVSEYLKIDEEEAINLLNSYGSFDHIFDELKNNKEFYFKGVEMKFLHIIHHEFMNERDFVLKIVQLNGLLLGNASEALQDDKEIVMIAVRNSNSLVYASDRLKNDEEIALESIKNFTDSFYYLGKKLLGNKEFLFKALRVNPLIVFDTEIDKVLCKIKI
jgi:hypothetical protein